MKLAKIALLKYRNYTEFFREIAPEGALITGLNGSGKTNLLEAISLFSFGKSFRKISDSDLISFEEKDALVQARFVDENDIHSFDCRVNFHKKNFSHNKKNISKISDLYQWVKTVYLSPSDIDLITGSPSIRRRFFDLAISQYDYNYLLALKKYNKALKQRNALLKSEFDRESKKVWDLALIESAAVIVEMRLNYLKFFNPDITKIYHKISSNQEFLVLNYECSHLNVNSYKENLKKKIKEIERREIQFQRTLIGPHLDDYVFFIDDKQARIFASQGQARSIVIAARLVQAHLIARNQSNPILMFDDVLADLDHSRTEQILDLLGNQYQIFVATPNAGIYHNILPEIKLGKD